MISRRTINQVFCQKGSSDSDGNFSLYTIRVGFVIAGVEEEVLAEDFLLVREDCDCWPGGATVAPAAVSGRVVVVVVRSGERNTLVEEMRAWAEE